MDAVAEQQLAFDEWHEQPMIELFETLYLKAHAHHCWPKDPEAVLPPNRWKSNPQPIVITGKWRLGGETIYRLGYESLCYHQLVKTTTTREDAALNSAQL